MNIRILYFLALIFCLSCDFQTEPKGEEKPVVTTETSNQGLVNKTPDFVCIPNKRAGKILANFKEEDIIAAYGKENVVRKDIGVGEGEIAKGTILFPDTKNELIIEWQNDFEYQKLKKIRIEKEASEWKTEEGIHTGTTLDELVKINGKDFKFYGFEWDYGGVTNDWDDGKINKQLVLMLDPGNPKALFPELLGEKLFSSAHPKAKEADLKVGGIVIFFGL